MAAADLLSLTARRLRGKFAHSRTAATAHPAGRTPRATPNAPQPGPNGDFSPQCAARAQMGARDKAFAASAILLGAAAGALLVHLSLSRGREAAAAAQRRVAPAPLPAVNAALSSAALTAPVARAVPGPPPMPLTPALAPPAALAAASHALAAAPVAAAAFAPPAALTAASHALAAAPAAAAAAAAAFAAEEAHALKPADAYPLPDMSVSEGLTFVAAESQRFADFLKREAPLGAVDVTDLQSSASALLEVANHLRRSLSAEALAAPLR